MFGQQSMNTPTEALLMLKAGDGADVSTEGVSCSARMATKAGGAPQMSDSGTTTVEDDSSAAPKFAASRTQASEFSRALLQSPPQHFPSSFPPIQPRPGASLESHCPVKEDKDKKHPVDWDEVADEDVLFGRGGITNTHVGNRYFRSLVDQFVAQYSVTQRGLKRGVATSLVASVRAYGGRFLKQDEKSKHWYEVGDEKAIEKATQSLREGVARE
jgi:hypothetical protein